MFRQLRDGLAATGIYGPPAPLGGPPGPAELAATDAVLTTFRPSQLSEYLEALWFSGRQAALQRALAQLPFNAAFHQDMARDNIIDPLPPVLAAPPAAQPPVTWPHIVYAYLLENTRMVDIFRRVVFGWVHGESLPTAKQGSQRWTHATEQLFFANAWSYSVRAVTSSLRPDSGSVRRNAYYRLLGMDLNHGSDDGGAYPYARPSAANRDFAMLFEVLLAEIWLGWSNRTALVSQNLTDNVAIINLVRRIQEMLQSRRMSGALSREEFDAVAMASWFHLTVELNSVVVQDLNAQSGGISDRLKKIGERVGLPAHARSDAFFYLADPMAALLREIENGNVFAAGAGNLYLPAGVYTALTLQIINYWSVATGRNVKDPTLRARTPALLAATAGPTPVALSSPRTGEVVAVMR